MTSPIGLIYSCITLLILLLILLRLAFISFKSRMRWMYFVAGSALSFLLLYLAGAWPYMSYYLRWVFILLWLGSLLLSYYRNRNKPFKVNGGFSYYAGRSLYMLAVSALIIVFFNGSSYPEDTVALDFPLRNGDYYVMQGGSNRFTNFFHSFYNRDKFGYALDIGGLGKFKNRSKKLFPKKAEDFVIYRDTIYSPCTGNVILVMDTVPDNTPGDFNVKEIHGNHLVLDCGMHRVFMAHLLKGNVFVKAGDKVTAGQPLALLGNSGFTAEPHLHISALKYFNNTEPLSGRSVPILFGGKFYALNDVIQSP